MRLSKTLIATVAFAFLLIGGTVAGYTSGSLAILPTPNTTPTIEASAATPTSTAYNRANPSPNGGAKVPSKPTATEPSPIVGSASTSGYARYQEATPVADGQVRGIVVHGSGQIQAQPDQATVAVGVQTRAQNAQDAQKNNNRTMEAVINGIKALGIPAKDIQTTGVSLNPVIQQGNTVSGYEATNGVVVTVEKVEQTGAVLDAAVKAGANTAGRVSFGFKDETGLRNKALAAAANDAQSKASAIATAIGVKITGVQSVTEGSVSVPTPFATPGATSSASPAVPIEPGQQTVTADVTVVYGY